MTADLFHVSTELSRLMAQREDLISEMQVAPTVDDQVRIGNAIEALEGMIRDEAMPNSVRKVDNFRGYILHLEMIEAASKKEKQRQAANEKQAHDGIEFMKRIAAVTMDATGKERLEGTLGHIRRQANGGPEPPPLIAQPDLIPDEFCVWRVEFSNGAWDYIRGLLKSQGRWAGEDMLPSDVKLDRIPSATLIREALIQPCPACDGTGEAEMRCTCFESICECYATKCHGCGGSGRAAVPGCSLQQRGSHVRIC